MFEGFLHIKKLFWLIFNYLKFNTITYFIYYILKYKSIINYSIIYNLILHKYFFQVFYNWTNKKKIKSKFYNIIYSILIAQIVKNAKKEPDTSNIKII